MRRLAKPVVFTLALVPLAALIFFVLTGRTSANPAEDILLTTGIWALRFLLLTLAITPLRRLTGWNILIQYRRMLGLFAFFYATVHLSSYIAFDRFFAFDEILADVAKRPFITAGMAAFVLMVPLAVTSTKGWIRRLGRRWQLLHRLIYLSATRRLPAFHLEGEGGARGAGLLRGDPRACCWPFAWSGASVRPEDSAANLQVRNALSAPLRSPPSGRLAAGFGPFTPPNCQLA